MDVLRGLCAGVFTPLILVAVFGGHLELASIVIPATVLAVAVLYAVVPKVDENATQVPPEHAVAWIREPV